MVPPEGIDKIAPTTLPADFGEWDSGDKPETQPTDFNGFDRFPGSVSAPKPAAKPATARVAVLPAAERPPVAPPRKPVRRQPEPEPVYERPQPKDLDMADFQEADESKAKQKKMLIGVGVLVLVLIGGVGYWKFSSNKPVTPNQPVASQAASTSPASTAMKPTAATTATTATGSPVQPTTTADATPAPQPGLGKQSQMMQTQLNAPSKISSDLKALGASQPEPTSGFNASGMEGMGNSAPVFNSGNGPKVKVQAPTRVTISNGVAVGLLIQKTAPVYPPIAKSARVQGTVVIQATISKTGTIQNSHVVTGPPMLRQAAMDAVRTWRFRPYLLDGEPVEVETTVNVVFNLGG